MTTLFEEIQRSIDWDLRVVTQKQYFNNPRLYGRVQDVIYLLDNEGVTTWVDGRYLKRLVAKGNEIVITGCYLVVQAREDKRTKFTNGELMDAEDYYQHYKDYTIMDVLMLVVSMEVPRRTRLLYSEEFELLKDSVGLLGIKYTVRKSGGRLNNV